MKREFHDAIITKFRIHNGHVEIHIENVWAGDDIPTTTGILVAKRVNSLTECGKLVELVDQEMAR